MSDPLGLTVVHTSPATEAGYDPDLNPWVDVGGTLTPDSGAPMGGWRPLSTMLNAAVPWAAFPPDTYQHAAIMRSATTQQIRLKWTTWAYLAGPGSEQQDEGERILTLTANKITWVPLGRTTLPAVRTRRGVITVRLEQTSGAAVDVGGYYAFRSGRNCGLTVADTTEPHLFIDSGDGANNPGSWMVGTNPDGSDAYTPAGSLTPGIHTFPPGDLFTYVITAGASYPEVSLRHRRAWTANAADDGTA